MFDFLLGLQKGTVWLLKASWAWFSLNTLLQNSAIFLSLLAPNQSYNSIINFIKLYCPQEILDEDISFGLEIESEEVLFIMFMWNTKYKMNH